MATYNNSNWGEIRGRLGEAVGKKWKGMNIVTAYNKPKESKDDIKLLEKIRTTTDTQTRSKLLDEQVYQKGINVKYLFRLTNQIATQKYNDITIPIWEKLADKYRKVPANLFVKINTPILRHSMPDQNKLCNETNAPDLTKIEFTPQYSGPPIPSYAAYNTNTGEIKLNWETPEYIYENPDDKAYAVALYFKPIDLLLWTKSQKPWKELKLWGSAYMPVAIRNDKSAVLQIDTQLDQKSLFVFLFFKNSHNQFSRTYNVPITSLATS